MSAPVRVQIRRTKGWRIPANTIVVSRRKGSPWGNPYKAVEVDAGSWRMVRIDGYVFPSVYESKIEAARAAVEQFRLFCKMRSLDWIRKQLAGKNLACWCPPEMPCHADVLLELANA